METALTPAEIAENERIKKLPAITELKEGQEDIKSSVEELSRTIEEEQKFNREEFQKGAKKFSKLENDIGEMRTEMNELKNEMRDGFKQINDSIGTLKQELKDDEIKKLTDELSSNRRFKNAIMSGVVITIATIILTAIFSNMPNVQVSAKQSTEKAVK